jgi:hypothetical protein
MAALNPKSTDRERSRSLRNSAVFRHWFEAEVLKQRGLGIPFPVIAELVTNAVHEKITPAVPLLDITFPSDFQVFERDVRKAYDRALSRFKIPTATEYLTIDNWQTDELWRLLQQGIADGKPDHCKTAIGVLDHRAKVNGYAAAQRFTVEGEKHPDDQEQEPEESWEFQLNVLRAMTDRERKVVDKIMERARARAKEAMARKVAK